jgi:hypothetical protein
MNLNLLFSYAVSSRFLFSFQKQKPIAVNQAIEFGALVIPKESFCGNTKIRHIAG